VYNGCTVLTPSPLSINVIYRMTDILSTYWSKNDNFKRTWRLKRDYVKDKEK
jgi:hypothetical protein